MKVGEAAKRLAASGVAAPVGVEWKAAIDSRNWLIHQYDHVDRAITWNTLATDIPAWRVALAERFGEAEQTVGSFDND